MSGIEPRELPAPKIFTTNCSKDQKFHELQFTLGLARGGVALPAKGLEFVSLRTAFDGLLRRS